MDFVMYYNIRFASVHQTMIVVTSLFIESMVQLQEVPDGLLVAQDQQPGLHSFCWDHC